MGVHPWQQRKNTHAALPVWLCFIAVVASTLALVESRQLEWSQGNLTANILFELPGQGLHSRQFLMPYDMAKQGAVGAAAVWLCHHAILPQGPVECIALAPDTDHVKSILSLAPSPSGYYNTQIYLVLASAFFAPVHVPITINEATAMFTFHIRFPMGLSASYRHAHHFCRRHAIHNTDLCAEKITQEVASRFQEREPLYVIQHSFVGISPDNSKSHEAREERVVKEEDVWILINSNCRFADHTLPLLLRALIKEAGWDPRAIRVGLGGCVGGRRRVEGEAGVVMWYAEEEMMDFNGLFCALTMSTGGEDEDLLHQRPYVFYMHDTMQVGPGFKEGLLRRASTVAFIDSSSNQTDRVSWPLLHPMSMNCGLYSTRFLTQQAGVIKDRLQSFSNITSLPERKRRLGHGLEDFVFHHDARGPPQAHHCLCPEITVLPPPLQGEGGGGHSYYPGGVPRARIYCPALDLIKLQSTYPGSRQYNNTDL